MAVKKCRICKTEFIPSRPMQSVCGLDCAIKQADKVISKSKQKLAKEERKKTKARKEKLKTRSDYMKEAQIEFNKFIRTRDAMRTCICCAQPLQMEAIGGGFDAGHYRSVGSAPHLRFNEHNVHGQTKKCNRWGAGRAIDYRRGLIDRIGIHAVEALEADQEPRKFTIEDLKAIKALYRQKTKELQK